MIPYKIVPVKNYNLVPLSSKKHIYSVKERPDYFVKVIEFNNSDQKKSIQNEINLQTISANYCFSPKILDQIWQNDKVFIIMEKVKGKTIYELYGDIPKSVPSEIWNRIRMLVKHLYCLQIEYTDITPYNFMIDNDNNILVIDFGHAKLLKTNWFLKDFLDGDNTWNPDFA